MPSFVKNRQWWVDHFVDIATLVATIVLTFFIHALDSNEREQDSVAQNAATKQLTASQDLARRQNGAENDLHQAYALLSELQVRRGTGQDAERRAIAEVVDQYSMDGHLYEPAAHIFVQALPAECDQDTFEYLKNAITAAANVSRRDAISNDEQDKDKAARAQTQSKMLEAIKARDIACKSQYQGHPTLVPKQLDIPLGYFDVACGEPRNESRSIPLKTLVPPGYKEVSLRADFKDTSNVKQATATAGIEGDLIVVKSLLVGIDAQAFPFGIKNCPGGGHGTLVLHIILEPAPPAAGAPEALYPASFLHSQWIGDATWQVDGVNVLPSGQPSPSVTVIKLPKGTRRISVRTTGQVCSTTVTVPVTQEQQGITLDCKPE